MYLILYIGTYLKCLLKVGRRRLGYEPSQRLPSLHILFYFNNLIVLHNLIMPFLIISFLFIFISNIFLKLIINHPILTFLTIFYFKIFHPLFFCFHKPRDELNLYYHTLISIIKFAMIVVIDSDKSDQAKTGHESFY